MHEPYKHLAECPMVSVVHPYIVRDHGTTLKPNQSSLDFIDSLYSEYLPNFSSLKFNAGLDEPWELGQGWSKKEVERKGKDKVYLDHLEHTQTCPKAWEAHAILGGRLLEKPENASLLSPSASPIIWGYEANHPFLRRQQRSLHADFPTALLREPGLGEPLPDVGKTQRPAPSRPFKRNRT